MRTETGPILLPRDAGATLLPLARAAIGRELGWLHSAAADAGWLRELGACFITLTHNAKLRGCIGTLRAHRALGEDVKANAVAAAFRDPRFKPLTLDEFHAVEVEVSVLSALAPITFTDEQDALRQLRTGIDGVIFQYGHHSGTFLPQVWESFDQPAEFMGQLKYKAGLPPDFWNAEVKLSRYTVIKWREGQ
ncbi:MAG: AMMECR1 domain-containing protein [Betaproteobacteria bacterium RIFCSPLOWO2_12_FULL_62_13]|nr:MAG: AMMECR1 domain-containing protein [Betaproteobacteria bacterium RIFCSPLOWO2_12_FULL_62_13]